MAATAIKGNLLILNVRNELIYSDGNKWAVLGHYATGDLEQALIAYGDRTITVQFKTTKGGSEADMKLYTKRLRSLEPIFLFRSFGPVVIQGHEIANTFQAKLYRIVP